MLSRLAVTWSTTMTRMAIRSGMVRWCWIAGLRLIPRRKLLLPMWRTPLRGWRHMWARWRHMGTGWQMLIVWWRHSRWWTISMSDWALRLSTTRSTGWTINKTLRRICPRECISGWWLLLVVVVVWKLIEWRRSGLLSALSSGWSW